MAPRLRTHDSVATAAHIAKAATDEADRNWRAQEDRAAGALPPKVKLNPVCKGVYGESPLLQLPYFDIVRDTLPDMMHIASGVLQQHLIPLLKGDRLKELKRKEDAIEKERKRQEEQMHRQAVAAIAKAAARRAERARQEARSAAVRRPGSRRAVVMSEDEEEKEGPLVPDDEDEEEEEKEEAAPRAPSVSAMQDRWRIKEAQYALIESKCLAELQAPSGIIGGKLPFTRTGEMTAHHWINFAKVYGPYLFAQHYKTSSLALLCDILKLLRLCVSSVVTPDLIKEAKDTARGLATWFDTLLPGTEKAIIFHLLIFHVPNTIEQWGPARNFWCFPFERSVPATIRH